MSFFHKRASRPNPRFNLETFTVKCIVYNLGPPRLRPFPDRYASIVHDLTDDVST